MNIIKKLKMENRENMVIFVKSLTPENPQNCTLCNGTLEYFHKKAKKSNNKWKCSKCNKKFEVTKILKELSNLKN